MTIEKYEQIKQDIKKLPDIDLNAKAEMTIEQAIDLAEQYGLGYEVEYLIFNEGLSPEEALKEWDLI